MAVIKPVNMRRWLRVAEGAKPRAVTPRTGFKLSGQSISRYNRRAKIGRIRPLEQSSLVAGLLLQHCAVRWISPQELPRCVA